MGNNNLYRGLKAAGMVFFIPFILAAGPLSGFFFGSFLEKKFSLPSFVSFACTAVGFIVAGVEIARIIRKISNIEKEP